MNLSPMIDTLSSGLAEVLPNLGLALVILIVGWLAAVVVRAGTRRLLAAIRLNERVASGPRQRVRLESTIATALYYLVIVVVVLAFFDALDLELVSGPLQSLMDQLFGFLPNLIAGGVLLVIALVLAAGLRRLARRALDATDLDERVAEHAGMARVSENLATVVYWIVLLLFLPAILGAFEVRGLLEPVEGMVAKALAVVPNIFAAGVIGFVGWLIARIVRDLVTNLLSATGANRLGETTGLTGTMTLSRLLGLVAYILILIPVLTAALNALKIGSITAPATTMLTTVMDTVPDVFAAALILVIAFFVARFVAGLVSQLLEGAGFDALPERIGMGRAFRADLTPSRLAGILILFFAMLFASVEAAGRIGFGQVSELVSTFIEFGGQVLLGVVIIGVGFWLSNLAFATIRRVYGNGSMALANVARLAILGLVLAMGLRAMGLADDIVNLAFGLTLGSVAVALALAFGLGGREAAGKQMEHWFGRLRKR